MYSGPGTIMLGAQVGNMQPNVPAPMSNALFRYGEQAIWSANRWAAAVALANQQFRYFATPLGQQGQGFAAPLTIGETNWKVGGFVSGQQSYDVYGISAYVSFGVAAAGTFGTPIDTQLLIGALVNIQNNSVFQWNFNQAFVDVAPFYLVGAGGGAYGAVSTTQNAADRGHMNNGVGNIWIYRQWPVTLAATAVFTLLQWFGGAAVAAPAGFDTVTKVSLLGFYRSAVDIG